MILCLGPTPAAQRVMVFRRLTLDAVNRAATTLDGAAGKAVNVAKVLHALGERPLATGFLGGDRGEYLRAVLRERGIEQDFVTVPERTRQCVTVIDETGGTVTELVEESRAVAPAAYEQLAAVLERHLPEQPWHYDEDTLTDRPKKQRFGESHTISENHHNPSLARIVRA